MIKVLFATILWMADGDSVRTETINGKQFIIHQIEAKETLYSISRRYGVTVTAIIESNSAAEGALAVGQLLKVPYTPKSKTKPTTANNTFEAKSANGIHTVAAGETLYSIAKQYSISVDQIKLWNKLNSDELRLGQQLVVNPPKNVASTTVPVPASAESLTPKSLRSTHVVAAKETLFSISKQYGISVAQLKEWNGLTNSELKLGQQLVVVQPKQTAVAEVPIASPASAPANTPTTSIKISEKVVGADEVREEGSCDLMPNTENNRKYLAFHRTAKIGSVLKVRNTQSNREVFVRVMGTMPTDVPSDVIIRISTAAMLRLDAVEGKCKVEVTYYQ
ncbi:MAG: LysM peptidoglycan-binding domain-containing protein [Flammeovirgaceae bacterium]